MKIKEITIKIKHNAYLNISPTQDLESLYKQLYQHVLNLSWDRFYLNAPKPNSITYNTLRNNIERFIILEYPETGLNIFPGDRTIQISLRSNNLDLYKDYISIKLINNINQEEIINVVDFIRLINMSYQPILFGENKQYIADNAVIHLTYSTRASEKITINIGSEV